MFDIATATVIFCALVAVVFLVLWFYYDHRDNQRYELERRRTTFHCVRCDTIYAAPGRVELSGCPKCGHENARLRF